MEVVRSCALSGLASCAAEALTLPIDVLKTRQQCAGPETGLLAAGRQLVTEHGLAGLFRGLGPALARQATYGAMRYGLYGPYLRLCGGQPTLLIRVVASVGSGATASLLTSPLDRAKILMQTGTSSLGLVGTLRGIFYRTGLLGLWSGASSSCARAAFLTAGELVTRGEAKRVLQGWLAPDGLWLVFCAAMCSGLVGVALSNPFDVMKSRMMAMKPGQGVGMLDCFRTCIAEEGLLSLTTGFWANYMRKAPHVVITFVCIDKLQSSVDQYGDAIWIILVLAIGFLFFVADISSRAARPGSKPRRG